MTHAPTVLLIGAEDEENLAVRSLAAYLRAQGIPTELAGFSREEETPRVLRAVRRVRPTVIALSLAFQRLADDFFQLIDAIRAQGYRGHIVVGGHFPTFEYATILQTQPGIDSVGRFEGEHSLAHLARAVAAGSSLAEVPNLVYRTPDGLHETSVIHDFLELDSLPTPLRARRPMLRLGERFATLISSRGCWHSCCLYCCIGAFHRQKPRKFILRSAAGVAAEIAALQREKGVTLFQFHDDNFVLETREATLARLRDLRAALQRQGVAPDQLSFLIKARPDALDAEVVEELAALGCVGIFLGIENASPTGLRALMRNTSLADVDRALEALAGAGIAVTYNLLIFHPHATLEEIAQNIAFVQRHPTLAFDFGRAEIVAGSPLERQVIREGRRKGQWPHWYYTIEDATVQRLFEVNLATFRAGNSAYGALMHTLIALSYQAYTVRRRYAGPTAETLLQAVLALITRSNHFILACLEQARALALQPPEDAAVAHLFDTLQEGCLAFLREADYLSDTLRRLQLAEQVFQRFHLTAEVQRHDGLLRLFGLADPLPRRPATTLSPEGRP